MVKEIDVTKREAIDRSYFRFTVSPSITYEVMGTQQIFFRIAHKVDTRLKSTDIESTLSGIVIFPIVSNPEIYVQKDWLVHKRRDRAYYIGKNIDYAKWKRAQPIGRIRLATKSLQLAVCDVPDRHLSAQSKTCLAEMIERIGDELLKSKRSALTNGTGVDFFSKTKTSNK